MQPSAKSVLAFSERVFYGCPEGDVDVTGMMAHSIGMMIAGARRPSGRKSEAL